MLARSVLPQKSRHPVPDQEETMVDVAVPSAAAEIEQWLSRFDRAPTEGDGAAAAELFGDESLCRDLVSFTWVNHTPQWFRPRGRLSAAEIADGYCELLLRG
jgi:hypothetical protein